MSYHTGSVVLKRGFSVSKYKGEGNQEVRSEGREGAAAAAGAAVAVAAVAAAARAHGSCQPSNPSTVDLDYSKKSHVHDRLIQVGS